MSGGPGASGGERLVVSPESYGPVPSRVRQAVAVSEGYGGPSVPSLRAPQYSQSLERGLAILESFNPERPVLGIADLADELGMSRPTTHRYAITLIALGYLVQGKRRKYQLGLGVTALGMAAMGGTSLREHARPYLEELSKRTGFTVVIAVRDGPKVLLVDRLLGHRRGQRQIDLDQGPGSRLPVHCTAAGKLLFAHLPKSEQRRAISALRLTGCTPNTITSKSALRAELQGILEGSLAVSEEELASGLYSIAAPVRSACGETTAAVGMDAHRSMISLGGLVGALGPHVIAVADRISARLGFRRADERAEGRLAPETPEVVA